MKIYVSIIICTFITACANPVSPTGGNKDITPPLISNIKIDSLSDSKTITIHFDEYIKTTNDIVLNPQRKTDKTPIISPSLKSIGFKVPSYTTSVNLTSAVRDLNESNQGSYPLLYFSSDTLEFRRTIVLNPYFKTYKKQFRLEKRIDSFYYRSYSVADTIYISGLPPTTNRLTAYLDANSNNTYDSTEWYTFLTLDSNQAVHLFPPIINKIEVDTTSPLIVAIIPFYFIGGSFFNDSTFYNKNDTFIISKPKFEDWMQNKPYPLAYKKIPLKRYIIKTTHIINNDTTITFNPSLGKIIKPDELSGDTLSEQKIFSTIILECDSVISNTKIIIQQNGKYFSHVSITQKTQSLLLPIGDYTIITYLDLNLSEIFDGHEQSDSIINYFEKIHVKPKLEHVIKIYNPVQNTIPLGGKDNPLLPITLQPKNRVEQTNITPE